MPVLNRVPYRDLVLTGTIGVGKTAVGRAVAQKLDVPFYDVENEIQLRENQSPEEIRSLFGEARLRTLEADLISELMLVRSAVIAVNGTILSVSSNVDKLRSMGPVLCLTAALNEILRRMHVAQGARFHSPDSRSIAVARLKRDRLVMGLDLPQLDTTGLSIEAVAEKSIQFWMEQSDI